LRVICQSRHEDVVGRIAGRLVSDSQRDSSRPFVFDSLALDS
jgi:hypothetical protein